MGDIQERARRPQAHTMSFINLAATILFIAYCKNSQSSIAAASMTVDNGRWWVEDGACHSSDSAAHASTSGTLHFTELISWFVCGGAAGWLAAQKRQSRMIIFRGRHQTSLGANATKSIGKKYARLEGTCVCIGN